MRISDWSSDVCSSDLERDAARGEADLAELADAAEIGGAEEGRPGRDLVEAALAERLVHPEAGEGRGLLAEPRRYVTRIDGEQRRVVVDQIGRASCRERVCQYG